MSLLNKKCPPHLLFNVIIRSKQYSLFKFCIPHFLELSTWDQPEQDVKHIIRAGRDNSLREPEVYLECLWMKSWWTAGARLNWPSLWGLILLCSKSPRAPSGHSGFPPGKNWRVTSLPYWEIKSCLPADFEPPEGSIYLISSLVEPVLIAAWGLQAASW